VFRLDYRPLFNYECLKYDVTTTVMKFIRHDTEYSTYNTKYKRSKSKTYAKSTVKITTQLIPINSY